MIRPMIRHTIRSFRCVIAVALLAGSFSTFAQEPSAAQPLDRIAAVVDEEIILQSELERASATLSRARSNVCALFAATVV